MKELTDSEPEDAPLEKPKKEVKPKAVRSQKQIDALNKGRAKALEVREANKKVRKQEFDDKVVKAVEDKVEKIVKSKPVPIEKVEKYESPRSVERIVEKHYYHDVGASPHEGLRDGVHKSETPKKKVVKKKVQIDSDEEVVPKKKVVKKKKAEDSDDESLVKKPHGQSPRTPSGRVPTPKPPIQIQFV